MIIDEHGDVGGEGDCNWHLELLVGGGDDEREEQEEGVVRVCLRPGQVLLFESARVPHARARLYANAFFHFAPSGWAQRLSAPDFNLV